MARPQWFALDVGFLGDGKIGEMGADFGPAGPLVVVAMYAAAKAHDEDGRFTIGYKNLARAAFVRNAKRVREIVARATELDIVRMIGIDSVGFTGFIPAWDEWQFGSGKTPAAARQARYRKRHAERNAVTPRDVTPDVTVTGTYTETYTEKAKAFSSEVVSLCDLLADLIEQNGSKRPPVTEGWKNSARLLLERDGRPDIEAERVLRWSQSDSFWRGNVLSMPTFRKRYDQLRLASQRSNVVRLHPSEERAKEIEALTEQWRREDGDGPEAA